MPPTSRISVAKKGAIWN